MQFAIIDLDNCISNDAWRHFARRYWATRRFNEYPSLPYQLQRLHDYHSLAPFDEAVEMVTFDFRVTIPIIITARPELYRHATLEWITRKFPAWNVNNSMLYMRADDDVNESALVKAKALHLAVSEHMKSSADIVCAYDDDLDVLRMYERQGIPVCRCDIAFEIFEHLEKGKW